MSDDHAKRALEMLEDVRDEQGTERGLRIAEAQVHATLALVEVLAPLAERLAHPPVIVETRASGDRLRNVPGAGRDR